MKRVTASSEADDELKANWRLSLITVAVAAANAVGRVVLTSRPAELDEVK